MSALPPVEAYRLWASSWDRSSSPVVVLENRYLKPLLQDLRGKTFIDVGCGTGRWMLYAQQAGARTMGIDLSIEMLRQASLKPGLRGRLAVADMKAPPLADEFADVVLCALSLGHCRDAGSVLAGLLQLARVGGRVLISDFHPDAIRNGWKRTFKCGSQTLEVESYPYDVHALVEQARNGGYQLEQLLELSFDAEEEQLFLAAGRPDLFARVRNLPAVLLVCLRRL
jgi:malonyl-CoA O-methyltransferase